MTYSRIFTAVFAAVFVTALMASVVKAEKPQIDCTKIRGVCYGMTPEEQAKINDEVNELRNEYFRKMIRQQWDPDAL